jgi:hypothetical protein
MHIHYISTTERLRPTRNMPLSLTAAIVYELVELGYSLLSATVPNLKSFIMSFDTAMMMDFTYELKPSTRIA